MAKYGLRQVRDDDGMRRQRTDAAIVEIIRCVKRGESRVRTTSFQLCQAETRADEGEDREEMRWLACCVASELRNDGGNERSGKASDRRTCRRLRHPKRQKKVAEAGTSIKSSGRNWE